MGIGLAIAAGILALAAEAYASPQHVAERGPAAVVVGTLFTVASPPLIAAGALRGAPTRAHACRLGHGLGMLAASPVALPAGLVLAPWYRTTPGAWMDAVVDAFQEDYCTRGVTTILP
jgi:hypothetical protein